MSDPALFRAYHRRRWLVTSAVRLAVIAGASAFIVIMSMVVAAAPGVDRDDLTEAQVPGAPVNEIVDALPQPEASSSPSPTPSLPEVLVVAAEPEVRVTRWNIDIATAGYQTELDACLWVRMDLGAAAPIVGAHNYCGGSIVLDMAIGDTVTLRGTSLDGEYTVEESRDARAGDNAAAVTEGMAVDAILQTCYVNSSGKARLLGLVRVS